MEQVEVERALNRVAYNRSQWNKAKHEFDKAAEKVTHRLLLEAAVAKMSVHQVSRCLQITPKRTRELMRRFGMNTKSSKALLAKDSAEALHANAELMGIDVKDFDLMSPLAYLPAGSLLKAQTSGQSKVTKFPETEEDRENRVALLTPCGYCDADTGQTCSIQGVISRIPPHPSRLVMARIIIAAIEAGA